MPIEHGFTTTILSILAAEYGEDNDVPMLDVSEFLGYLDENKIRFAQRRQWNPVTNLCHKPLPDAITIECNEPQTSRPSTESHLAHLALQAFAPIHEPNIVERPPQSRRRSSGGGHPRTRQPSQNLNVDERAV